MKRVIVFGAQKICIDVVKYLSSKDDVELCGVVSSDQERDRIFSDYLLEEFCNKQGIKTIAMSDVLSIKTDLILSVYYRKIIPQEVLSKAKIGAINIHPALLPRYRGCVPTYWAILNGERVAGTTLHYMTGGIDDGKIIAQAYTEIDNSTGPELHAKMMEFGLRLVKENIYDVFKGKNPGFAQNNEIATYFGPYRECFKYINWNNNAKSIVRHIRAHHVPFQGSTAWNKYCEIVINECNIIYERGWPTGKYEFDGKNILIQSQDNRILAYDWKLIGGDLKKEGMFVSGIKGV